MPDRYRIIITPRASSDLEEIHQYITQDSEQNAAAFIAKLIAAIDGLEQFPHRYRIYTGQKKPSEAVRRMPVWPYLIYYRVQESQYAVDIITIRHGARRQPRRFEQFCI